MRLAVRPAAVLPLVLLAAVGGCSSRRVEVPPRLDLRPYGRVALATFQGPGVDSTFRSLVTQRFAEMVLAAQPGVELVELGAADAAVRTYVRDGDAAALAQTLGRERQVAAVFVGEVRRSDVQPSGRVTGGAVQLRATVEAELAVRLLVAASGGTTWRGSSRAAGSVGGVDLAGGRPSVAVRDPDAAYGQLVRTLVAGVSADFWPTWVRR